MILAVNKNQGRTKRGRKAPFSLFWVAAALVFSLATCRNNSEKSQYTRLRGQTMGTTWSCIYEDSLQRDFSASLQQLLDDVNASLSTYIDSSLISRLNRDSSVSHINLDQYFSQVFKRSKTVYQWSNGAFNPAVMPLVNYWGFGYVDTTRKIDSAAVDSLLSLVDFSAFHLNLAITDEGDTVNVLTRDNPAAQLDFSAIAKGYGVDVLAEFLERQQVENYLVEIGGEVRTHGSGPEGKAWEVGIEKPAARPDAAPEVYKILFLENNAVATSGNYRNQRVIDGITYAHTINPRTGFPELNDVLSATVVAPDCMTADALATACMVLGSQRAIALIDSLPDVEVLLLAGNAEGILTEMKSGGFDKFLGKPED